MRRRENELAKLGVNIVVVTFEAGFTAEAYVEDTGISWPLLTDEDRVLYRAYDMLTAGFWDILGPKTWWAYLKEMLKGKMPKKSTGDVSQRGGDVLIDPSGTVMLHHVGDGPADRPAVEMILSIIRNASR